MLSEYFNAPKKKKKKEPRRIVKEAPKEKGQRVGENRQTALRKGYGLPQKSEVMLPGGGKSSSRGECVS